MRSHKETKTHAFSLPPIRKGDREDLVQRVRASSTSSAVILLKEKEFVAHVRGAEFVVFRVAQTAANKWRAKSYHSGGSNLLIARDSEAVEYYVLLPADCYKILQHGRDRCKALIAQLGQGEALEKVVADVQALVRQATPEGETEPTVHMSYISSKDSRCSSAIITRGGESPEHDLRQWIDRRHLEQHRPPALARFIASAEDEPTVDVSASGHLTVDQLSRHVGPEFAQSHLVRPISPHSESKSTDSIDTNASGADSPRSWQSSSYRSPLDDADEHDAIAEGDSPSSEYVSVESDSTSNSSDGGVAMTAVPIKKAIVMSAGAERVPVKQALVQSVGDRDPEVTAEAGSRLPRHNHRAWRRFGMFAAVSALVVTAAVFKKNDVPSDFRPK